MITNMIAASLAIIGAFALVIFVMYYIGTGEKRHLVIGAGCAIVAIGAIWLVGMPT